MLDAEANLTTYTYDERDLIFKVTPATNSGGSANLFGGDANTPQGITQYDYDSNGNLKKITDANLNPTDYAFDLYDRLLTKTYANSTFHQYDYDKNSNLIEHLTPSLKPIEYTYDALNRLLAISYPLSANLDKAFGYDLGSRLTDAVTQAAENSFSYDALNRLTTNIQTLATGPRTLVYEYDKKGNRTKLTYPSGRTVDYTYDDNDRMKNVIVNGATQLAKYTYDPLDRRLTKELVPGIVKKTTYQYDLASQLLDLSNEINPQAFIQQFVYGYDQVGNRTSESQITKRRSSVGIWASVKADFTYGYNGIYELESVVGANTHSYDYDNVGNRLTADGITYTSNNLNQYTQIDLTTLTYDGNGNLTNDGVNAYTYDEENRLTTVTGPQGVSSYEYDAFNRRVSKTVDGLTTYFAYDGAEDIAEYDSVGVLQAEYVYGSRLDEVLMMSRNSQLYYYFCDILGSVVALSDAQGNIIESYGYDAYGNPTTTSSVGNPFMFTGRRYDEESGLYYLRARQYHPTIGRFLQRDPIDFQDGLNIYAYVGNQPINYTDAYGFLSPNGACKFGICIYTKEDFEDGKNKLKEEMKKKYPWMNDNDLEKIADDIMKEMKPGEAQKLQDLEKKNKPEEAEELLKEICERTGANCDPKEPKEDEACEQGQQ